MLRLEAAFAIAVGTSHIVKKTMERFPYESANDEYFTYQYSIKTFVS